VTTFVLVHGGWGGGWEWGGVEERLRALGHVAHRPTLTGLGDRSHLLGPAIDLDTHIADVRAVLEFEDLRDVVLCGHSYGGMVVTGVVDRDASRISRVVYVEGLVPRDGECVLDVVPADVAERLRAPAAEAGGVRLPIPLSHAEIVASHGAWYAERIRDQPLATFTQPLRLEREPGAGLPCTYIRTTKERDPTFDESARRARELGWRYEEIATIHDAQIDDPDGLVELLVAAAG
jgi:pimeloyl-ACP methyl ester carboxylesterase